MSADDKDFCLNFSVSKGNLESEVSLNSFDDGLVVVSQDLPGCFQRNLTEMLLSKGCFDDGHIASTVCIDL